MPDTATVDVRTATEIPPASTGLMWAARGTVTIVGLSALSVSAVAALVTVHANTSFALVLVAALVLALAIAGIEARGYRTFSFNLFLWGFIARVLFVTLCSFAATREGGPFLGPDATGYFNGSIELAARAFHLPDPAVVFFGSYDVGQYYLFAVMIRYAHTDLFGLQVMNCAFTALAAPLAFAIARDVVPRWAAAVGVGVALSPSLIGLSTIDLLKDPSIVFGMLALIWLLLQLRGTRFLMPASVFAAVAGCVALYLRTSRFYVFTYIEAGFVVAVLAMFRASARAFVRPQALALSVLVFGVAEFVPTRALWPTSPVMFLAMTTHTLNTAGMRWSSPGFLQRRIPGLTRLRLTRLPQEGNEPRGHSFVMLCVDMTRRVFAPFPWIVPRTWTFAALQEGQYYLFPGTLVWYALLPFVALGFATLAVAIVRGTEQRFAVIFLCSFAALYFAQYLLINLSFRQREAGMPILLMFAAEGIDRYAPDWRHPPRWYGRYWVAIVVVAVLHLIVRAILHLS